MTVMKLNSQCLLRAAARFHSYWRCVPSNIEVTELKQLFPNPESTFHELNGPHAGLNSSVLSDMSLESQYNGQIWKAKLPVQWPVYFEVCGLSQRKEDSVQAAYLLACDMYRNIGLIDRQGNIINCKEKISESQDLFFKNRKSRRPIHYHSIRSIEPSGRVVWHTELQISFPVDLKIKGYGLKQRYAEQDAASRTIVKLRTMRLLDNNCNIFTPKCLELPFRVYIDENYQAEDMDYHIYTDASQVGYGAYLVEVTKSCNDEKEQSIHWIHDKWSDSVKQTAAFMCNDSSFLEFYSILASIYTWKKKFLDARVLIYCDNKMCVSLLNNGLHWYKKNNFKKLFQVLRDTCKHYNIHIYAQHIDRYDNYAADMLCKGKIEKFKTIVPNASEIAKKDKKLKFFYPLVDQLVHVQNPELIRYRMKRFYTANNKS